MHMEYLYQRCLNLIGYYCTFVRSSQTSVLCGTTSLQSGFETTYHNIICVYMCNAKLFSSIIKIAQMISAIMLHD